MTQRTPDCAYSVSAGALNHRVLLPLNAGRRNMFSCVVTARTRCFTSTINSIGNTATRFASVLGKLTGRTDLTHLTMLSWKPVLPTQLLTRGVAAWCPQCLNGWRKGGKTIHMPLLWALEVVKFCPDHRCPCRWSARIAGNPSPCSASAVRWGIALVVRSGSARKGLRIQMPAILFFRLNPRTGRCGQPARSRT